ncbi:MAG: hypothetical protein PWP08_66 [Methanofollis sp.]|nr:hypothetical protein [Methanofollis sp.]
MILRDEEAVSEVIGTVLLISLTVLGVAIVAVALFSQPPPTEIPHVSVVAGRSADNATFVLFHEGGDALARGNYHIYADTGSGLVDLTDNFTLAGDDIWSIGENLTYDGDGTQIKRVVVSAVDPGGGETMIAEPNAAGTGDAGGYADTGGSGTWPVVVVTPEPTPTPEEIIVSPEMVTDIEWQQQFDFAAKIERNDTERVDLIIYNYDDARSGPDKKITSAQAYEMTKNAAMDFYYNRTLQITGSIGQTGDRISITVIAYNATDIIASQSVLSIIQ